MNDDHIIPQKWFKNIGWTKSISELALIKAIDDIENKEYKESFNEMHREELWNDKSSKESFIQLIGNKWYIHYKENIKASDIEWSDFLDRKGNEKLGRKNIYINYKKTANAYFFMPTFQDPTENIDFGIKEVINRTIRFYELIKDNDKLGWNSLKVD